MELGLGFATSKLTIKRKFVLIKQKQKTASLKTG